MAPHGLYRCRGEDRWVAIVCETDELTCLCPVTGQPDFATVRITYVPDETAAGDEEAA